MLPDYYYVLAAVCLSVVALSLLPFRRGRAHLRRSLPAVAFLGLLLGTAEIALRVGHAQGGGVATDTTIYTCSMHPQVRQNGPGLCPICHMELVPVAAVGSASGASAHELQIDPLVVQNMGVRVHTVARGPLRRAVRAFGELRVAESRQFDVALKIAGFVEQLFADTEGMAIAKGAPLFTLYSPDLVVAQAELIAARQSGDASLLAAARQKLRLWDVPEAEVDRLQQLDEPERQLRWLAPFAGVLLQKDIVAGTPAEQNRVLLRIADLSLLWLDAQVPAGQLAGLAVGDDATATLPSQPGREFAGRVVFVAPEVDRTTRTAIVRIEIHNHDGAQKPGMFARVLLHAPTIEDAVLAPYEAVIDTGGRQLAWLAVGKGRFEPRVVDTGRRGDDGLVEIRSGLLPGDVVVTSGQFLIDAESRLREGTRKFGSDGLMPGGDLPVPAGTPLADATQTAIDALLVAYTQVGTALAADRKDGAGWATLQQAAATAAAVPEIEVQVVAAELALALQRPAGDLEAMRVAFKIVSATAVRLFEIARPRAADAAATHLFVQHCPMAEADWLQLEAKTRNPYYGSSMLECGSVRRELPLARPAPGQETGK